MRAGEVIILGFILMSSSAFARKSEEAIPLCSAFHFKSVKAKLIESNNDKYKHCAVSCMLARRCGIVDSYYIGVLKEIWDLFTPGDADLKDIEADIVGIRMYNANKGITDNQCNAKCINYNFN